jgi:signal transduction histidine kinase/CheY-like chemotaxis protein
MQFSSCQILEYGILGAAEFDANTGEILSANKSFKELCSLNEKQNFKLNFDSIFVDVEKKEQITLKNFHSRLNKLNSLDIYIDGEKKKSAFVTFNRYNCEGFPRIGVILFDKEESLKCLTEIELVKSRNFYGSLLANLSHELRTPLSSLIGYAGMLKDELMESDKLEWTTYANLIYDSANELLTLLNNLIDLSRIESKTLQLELSTIYIGDVASYVAKMFKDQLAEKGLRLELAIQDNYPAKLDENRLYQALQAIVENAVEYTEQGNIIIETGQKQDEEGKHYLYCIVEDTGVGISQEFLPFIFEPFRQESFGYSKKKDGSGLGLTLAKGFIEAMQGTIKIDSIKNKGTVVEIRFYNPLIEDEYFKPRSENDKLKRNLHLKALPQILLVEDDAAIRKLIVKIIAEKAEVYAAGDGDEALELLANMTAMGRTFDLVIMDIGLKPPWDGISLKNEILNRYSAYTKVPFIALTAFAMLEDKKRIIAAGFTRYLSKPINRTMLLDTITELTQK